MAAPPDPKQLSDLPGRSLRGTFFRAVPAAFAAEPLSLEGSLKHGGRYNPMGAFGALYCGESPAVCAGEIRKRAAGHPVLPHRLARIQVHLQRVLDLTDPATVTTLGLRPEQLMAEDWQPTQQLAAQARAAGFEALLVPSAVGPGRNLVVFSDRLDPESRVRLVGTLRPFRILPRLY